MIALKQKVQNRLADSLDFVSQNRQLSAAMKVADADLGSFEEKGIQAGLLRNFQSRVMDSVEGRDFMKVSNFGPFLPELLPVIIAWYPNFPLKELISVQDMEQDLAYIITSELLTGTNKAPTLAGQKVETPNGLRNIKGPYPNGEIFGEEISTEDIVTEGEDAIATLVYYPLMSGPEDLEMTALDVKAGDAVYQLKPTTVSGGNIQLACEESEDITATIEIKSGIVTVSGAGEVSSISAAYVWNIEYADGKNIPTVVEDMKMIPMVAKPRVLAMKWTIFSELVKKKQFGDDIRVQTTKRVLDLLYQYLVRYILDRMYKYMEGGEVTIDGPAASIIDPNFKAQEILRHLNEASMVVANNTGRIEGNRIVTGQRFKNYLEALPEQWYKPFEEDKDYGFQGPRKIGQFGKFIVFYDNELPADEAFMTYRGSQWYDAAYYLGVFMPLVPTDAINLNINVQQAFCDMNAHRYDKPKGVVKLVFTENV